MDRFTNRPTGCRPTPTTGFAVTYTPAAGFRGIDKFSLDVEFKETGRREADTFYDHRAIGDTDLIPK
jgi:hypothetical protein